MHRKLAIALIFFAVSAWCAQAQDNQSSIRVEAEIISGIDSGGGGSTGGGSTGGGTVTPGNPGNPDLNPDVDGDVDQVAARLVTSAQTGDLALTDTAQVAALFANRRSNRQNVESLVTITVIDANGNVRSTTMRQSDLRADLLAPSAGLTTFQPQIQQTSSGRSTVVTGDLMRRSAGITYFYVQVCSCGI